MGVDGMFQGANSKLDGSGCPKKASSCSDPSRRERFFCSPDRRIAPIPDMAFLNSAQSSFETSQDNFFVSRLLNWLFLFPSFLLSFFFSFSVPFFSFALVVVYYFDPSISSFLS
jgi:hypothetical protein